MFVWMIFSISDNGVSANGTGISWDAPTLFTAHQHYQTEGRGGEVPRIPISRVFASSSILANPVSLSSGLETSIATTLVSTLYLAATCQFHMEWTRGEGKLTNLISNFLSSSFPSSNKHNIESLLSKLLGELGSDTGSSTSDYSP
jgi:hypothetical protein